MEEILILAIFFNILLLVIAWFASSRAMVLVSSVIWILIGFALYQSYAEVEDLNTDYLILLIAITYLIAFAQFFIPLRRGNA